MHLFDLARRVGAVRPLAVALAFGLVIRVCDELLELADGDFMRSQVKPLGQFHLVLDLLSLAAGFAFRRAHQELSRRDEHEFHPHAVLDFLAAHPIRTGFRTRGHGRNDATTDQQRKKLATNNRYGSHGIQFSGQQAG